MANNSFAIPSVSLAKNFCVRELPNFCNSGHYDMLYQDARAVQLGQPVQVNLLSHVDSHSDVYYLAQPSSGDLFAMLSPNQSVWQEPVSSGPYQPLQNHPESMPTSFSNVYSPQYPDQYPYAPTANVSPMEPSVAYGQSWSSVSASNSIPVTASPISPTMRTSPREDPIDEPKIRRNNYSLLVHNHQFPSLESGLPP